MAAAAGVTRTEILSGNFELSSEALARFDAMLARRENREPLAYIVATRNSTRWISRSVRSADSAAGDRTRSCHRTRAIVPMREHECSTSVPGPARSRLRSPLMLATFVLPRPIFRMKRSPLPLEMRCARVAERITFRRADCFEVCGDESLPGRFD